MLAVAALGLVGVGNPRVETDRREPGPEGRRVAVLGWRASPSTRRAPSRASSEAAERVGNASLVSEDVSLARGRGRRPCDVRGDDGLTVDRALAAGVEPGLTEGDGAPEGGRSRHRYRLPVVIWTGISLPATRMCTATSELAMRKRAVAPGLSVVVRPRRAADIDASQRCPDVIRLIRLRCSSHPFVTLVNYSFNVFHSIKVGGFLKGLNVRD